MPVLHVSVTSPLPPQEALQQLTDFNPRAEAGAGVDDKLIVHDQGDGWAEVTEGNKLAWEQALHMGCCGRYRFGSHPELQHLGTWKWRNYTILPEGAGSRVDYSGPEGLRNQGKAGRCSVIAGWQRLITSSTTARSRDLTVARSPH